MFVSQEGPASALHLGCNRNFDQVNHGTYKYREITYLNFESSCNSKT